MNYLDDSKNHEKGFTLIEAVITMFIIAIGLLAMAQLLITNINVNKASEVRMDASAAVEVLLEEAAVAVNANAANCLPDMLLQSASRTYISKNYLQRAMCKEILGAGNVQQERYWIQVQIYEEVTTKQGTVVENILNSGSTVITTAKSEL